MADRFGYGEIGLDIHPCRGCEDYDESDGCKSNGGCGKPLTNADKIRAMTDEELAKKISGIESFALTCGGGWPPEKWLDWLEQEAK
jgi:hypothetical protein